MPRCDEFFERGFLPVTRIEVELGTVRGDGRKQSHSVAEMVKQIRIPCISHPRFRIKLRPEINYKSVSMPRGHHNRFAAFDILDQNGGDQGRTEPFHFDSMVPFNVDIRI